MSDSGESWKEKLDRLSTWRAEMTEEAFLLPQTLADLRGIIGDLKRISARLEKSTEGIEILLRRAESSGLAPLARQLDAAATQVEEQMREMQEQLPGPDLMTEAMSELQKTVEAFTTLLPKPKPRK